MLELVGQADTKRMGAYYRFDSETTMVVKTHSKVKNRESQELDSILQSLKFETCAV